MINIKISASLKSIFGQTTEYQGQWPNMVAFFDSLPQTQKALILTTSGALIPFVRVRINGKIIDAKNLAGTPLKAEDDVSLFTVASGG